MYVCVYIYDGSIFKNREMDNSEFRIADTMSGEARGQEREHHIERRTLLSVCSNLDRLQRWSYYKNTYILK